MANNWKATARKYLKSMHGSRAALKKASAEYRGGKRQRNPGMDWGKIALVAGIGYVSYKYVLPQLRQPASPPAGIPGI